MQHTHDNSIGTNRPGRSSGSAATACLPARKFPPESDRSLSDLCGLTLSLLPIVRTLQGDALFSPFNLETAVIIQE